MLSPPTGSLPVAAGAAGTSGGSEELVPANGPELRSGALPIDRYVEDPWNLTGVRGS